MPALPIKKLTLRMWVQIFGIWTLAALSMSIQVYLNTRQHKPDACFLILFLKQIPHWYLCVLLTPVIIYFYECYPLDTPQWRRNLLKQFGIAMLVLSVFAHPRMFAISIITEQRILDISL